MQKKGYFFMLDAALGLGILILGAFLIYSSYHTSPLMSQTTLLSEDVAAFFSKTKIKDLNNDYAGVNGILWDAGNITNEDNTLLQQMGEFYWQGKYSLLNSFVQNVTYNVMVSKYDFEIIIENTLIFPQYPSIEHIDSKNKTKLLLSSSRIAYGISNKTTGQMWGPYAVEVMTWE